MEQRGKEQQLLKVVKAVTTKGAKEKSPILLSHLIWVDSFLFARNL